MIALEDGSIAATPQQATERWRRHFAGMEGGSVVTRQSLLQQVSEPSEQISMDLQQIPSLFELEKQLRASRTQRAMGPDNIPGELLHFAPQYLAHVLWPLYIKQSLTISEAIQYKGGRLVSAYKRRGDYKDCNSHRALLVSSSLGKATHNTFRRRAQAFVRSSAGDMQVTSHQHPSVLLAAHTVRCHMNIAKRTSTSAFALFLDISQAFYRVIRQFACDADCSDEHIVQFLRRMNIEEFCIDDIARMLEHGPALQHQDCPEYLPKQVTQLHDCTWFVLAGDTEVVKTERGTRPGDGFADTIWSLVFAKWIHRMEERLRATGAFPPMMWNNEVGLNTAIGEHAVPYSLVAWADDVVLLGLDEDPEQLLDKLKFSCQTMVEELTSYGLIPNFNGGKTEAVVDPRGNGSTQIRRRIFTAGKGILELDTQLPDQPHLRLVPKYKHLGGLITHGAKMRPEVAARSAQALQAFTTYRTKLYRNPHVNIPTKFMVLQATALATLHYGSGTWSTRLTAQELKLWTTTHFTLYRRMLQRTYAFERIRHMTDDEILVTVQEVHPHITLRLQRLLWYGSMLRRSCPTFWAPLAYEQWWLQRIAEDMDWFYSQLVGYTWLPDPRVDLEAWHLLATQQPSRWKKLLKRARLHALWQHTVHYNVDRYHRKAFDLLIQAGASLPSTVQEEVERAHYCFICQRTFATHRSWAVHSFKLHQRINKWRRLQSGAVCLACGKRFPSEARLIRHLQSVRACANTVASQRIWAPQRPAFGSTQERSLLLSTWEHTETPCLPAAAGWTMTWQTRSFLQFCTTVQWTSTDVEHQCLRQLQQHAVCGQELDEIEEALELTLQCDEQKAAMHEVFTCLKNMQDRRARPLTAKCHYNSVYKHCQRRHSLCGHHQAGHRQSTGIFSIYTQGLDVKVTFIR